jgi:hypothetical protein
MSDRITANAVLHPRPDLTCHVPRASRLRYSISEKCNEVPEGPVDGTRTAVRTEAKTRSRSGHRPLRGGRRPRGGDRSSIFREPNALSFVQSSQRGAVLRRRLAPAHRPSGSRGPHANVY